MTAQFHRDMAAAWGKNTATYAKAISKAYLDEATRLETLPAPPVVTPPPVATPSFHTSGSKIIGPDGLQFVPFGANLNGADWCWNSPTAGKSAVAKRWGWNTVRLNCSLPGRIIQNGTATWTTNNDLAGIVKEYTSAGIVVMLAQHYTAPGSYPTATELADIQAWWVAQATAFKGNPYVWFNLLNEPGAGNPASSQWLSAHSTLISAIRALGAMNIIVCDGSQWGQDAGDGGPGLVNPANSAILSYGSQLTAVRTNIVFACHVYDQYGGWSSGMTDTQRDARLAGFIDAVQTKGLPLIIGETGSYGDKPPSPDDASSLGTKSLYRVGPSRRVGAIAWHGQPGDGFNLVTQGPFDAIDAATPPSNLTWHGKLLWAAAHA